MTIDCSQQAEELLELCRGLERVELRAVAAFLQALRAGQEIPAALEAASITLTAEGRPALSLEAYRRFSAKG